MTATLTRPDAGPVPVSRRRAAPAAVLTFAGTLTAVWVAVAIRAAGRGFDITDEGFYLLSYRWWDADQRTFTGSQYLYGPVFALLGHDIVALRIFRLGTVLIGHLLFGVAFMRWLRQRRADAPPTRVWEAAGAATIVAAGGVVYAWLPQTPGYNDIVLLGALLSAAVVFALARHAERGDPAPAWLPVAFGALAVPVLLTKWAAVATLGMLAGLAVLALAPAGLRAVWRATAWALAGFGAGAALVHLLVVPLTTALPPIIAVNRLLAQSSFAIPTLLSRYLTQTRPTVATLGHAYALLLGAVVLAALVHRPAAQAAAGLLGAVGLAGAVAYTVRDGGLGGGPVNSAAFVVPLLATIVVAVLAAGAGWVAGGHRPGSRWRTGARDGVLLGGLAVLPLAVASGTSNVPLKVAVLAFAAWMAVLVAVVTGLDRRAVVARGLTTAVAAGALLVATCVATGGLWRNPYRDVPRDRATAAVPGVPALDGVRIEPARARAYADLRARLAPYLDPPGRKVIGLDKMAGIVVLLDGRTVGEGWYAPADPARIRAGIAAECAAGPPWPPDRAPVLVFNRPVRATDAGLIEPCGLRLADYRLLAAPDQTGGFTVLVPN
ncbi:hypothetical protein EV385_4440 [Krasilnikovia cinnamomea]|uniref:4-amino-4-deoxy-L-arabinose transferase-like glycosyltransferase n=1 Tax=Krasilnikovia cinnamomea TaxID=349313 RepID=A0A4Q7ZNG0_9ACTN|nr:hypothetical protein [Krasilnikovia cinnamomea]RZU52567.1 hypothetical protein EV385_4440 [Krasilnikovia cinnamomea]